MLTALSAFGYFDSILTDNFILSIAVVSIPLIVTVLFALSALYKPIAAFGVYWFVLVSTSVSLGVRTMLFGRLQEFGQLQNTLYLVTVFTLAASATAFGKKGAWGTVVLFYAVVHGVASYQLFPGDLLTNAAHVLSGIIVLAGLTFTGLLPFFLERKTAAQQIRETSRKQQIEIKQKKQQQSGTESPGTATSSFIIQNSEQIHPSNSLNELLSNVVYFVSRALKAHTVAVFTYDSANQVFKLNTFQSKCFSVISGAQLKLYEGVFGSLGTTKQLFMSGDLSLYHGSELFYYSVKQPVNSVLAVSVMSGEKDLLGFILVDKLEKNAFTDQDKEFLKRFSGIAAALITNVTMRLFQEKAAATFQVFYEASHSLTNTTKTSDVFEVLFAIIPKITPFTRLMSVTFNQTEKSLTIRRIAGEKGNLSEGQQFQLNAGLFFFSATKGRVVKIPDMMVGNTTYYRLFPNEPREPKLRSLIILPVIDEHKKCIALLSVESDTPGHFTDKLQQTLSILVENASVAYMRAVLFKKMELLATTDGLTGLNNNRSFREKLASEFHRASRYNHNLALLLMDIDHFKSFNDTYGHPVGDLVLKEIAKCITSSIRACDFPARYGGEEFVVIVPETDLKGVMATAERIRKTIEDNVIVSGENRLKVTMSIGCVVYPLFGASEQDLVDSADKALYFSKEHGRNRVTIFQKKMTVA